MHETLTTNYNRILINNEVVNRMTKHYKTAAGIFALVLICLLYFFVSEIG